MAQSVTPNHKCKFNHACFGEICIASEICLKDESELTDEDRERIRAVNGHEECSRCYKESNDLFMCERCESMICDDCQAKFTQHSQIDFNCCQSCADINPDE